MFQPGNKKKKNGGRGILQQLTFRLFTSVILMGVLNNGLSLWGGICLLASRDWSSVLVAVSCELSSCSLPFFFSLRPISAADLQLSFLCVWRGHQTQAVCQSGSTAGRRKACSCRLPLKGPPYKVWYDEITAETAETFAPRRSHAKCSKRHAALHYGS